MPLPIKEILNSKQQKRKCHKQMYKKKNVYQGFSLGQA